MLPNGHSAGRMRLLRSFLAALAGATVVSAQTLRVKEREVGVSTEEVLIPSSRSGPSALGPTALRGGLMGPEHRWMDCF
jgi:hypothetical protein